MKIAFEYKYNLYFFQAIQKKLVIDFVRKELEILESEAH